MDLGSLWGYENKQGVKKPLKSRQNLDFTSWLNFITVIS